MMSLGDSGACAEPPVGEVAQAVGAVQAVQAVLVQGGKPMAFDASLPVASSAARRSRSQGAFRTSRPC